ncbi:MAG TPA: hypothetical protein VES67_04855 [Vicinamibacterales bacterium]|nr:hypothetical protein [Vicinamibacterales bacterium]
MKIRLVAGFLTLTVAMGQGTGDDRRDAVLDGVGRYIREYERTFSAVVCREFYVQRLQAAAELQTRLLRSEVALIALGDAEWILFRDVYEVDGRAVHDRQDRLTALFLKPTADLALQAKRILDEGTRYNIGPITRTLNTPTQALAFLRPENQARSRFRLGSRTTVDGVETVELQFDEIAMPRMIGTRDNAPASGRFWIVPSTGAVVRSELRIASVGATAVVSVRYGQQAKFLLFVPILMTESYELEAATTGSAVEGFPGLRSSSKGRIEGQASYSDCRQFSVDTATIFRR